MKTSKMAKILSAILALAVILCSLPFALGVTASAESNTIDYSALKNNLKPHITYYRNTLGMRDATGLRVKDGAVIPDGDWWWQLNVVDKSIENSPAFAIYDVTPNTEFVVNFSATTDTSAMKFYVSENQIDWYLADTAGDEKTVAVSIPYYANYLKIVWPLGADVKNGIVSVNYTKPAVDANNIFVDYEAVKPSATNGLGNGKDDPNVLNNRGVWQSNNYQMTDSGIITPHYNNLDGAKTANSFDCYATYKVQPNTYFNLSTTVNRSAIDQISAKLGYYFGMQIYVSSDNVNFTKLDVEPIETAGYGNNQGNADARRRVDYSFIVPEGMAYVKCKLPITQNLSTMLVNGEKVWPYIGNDIFDISKVEFTRFKYDYAKLKDGDYFIDKTFSADTVADFGAFGYGGGVKQVTNGFTTDWNWQANNGHAGTYITYTVEPGTPFFAGFKIEYLPNLDGYLGVKDNYTIKLQGKNGNTWVDAADLVITAANTANVYYSASISAEDNIYDQVRVLWPARANGSQVGADCLALQEVAFTPSQTTLYDYTKCTDVATLTTTYGALSYTSLIRKSTAGLALDWTALYNAGGEGTLAKSKLIYKIDSGKHVKVEFNKNAWYNDTPKWDDNEYVIKVYTSATEDFANATEQTNVTMVENKDRFYTVEFDVTNEQYVKIEYPQTCRINTDKVGNDVLRLTGLTISKPDLVLDGISVDTEATNLSFYKGDAFSADGFVVGLTYTNGEYRRIDSGFELGEADTSVLGEQEVYFDYGDQSSSYTINVFVYDGDFNCDKNVNMLDLIRLKKIATKSGVSDGADADIDNSGAVDGGDLTRMKKFILGASEAV